MKHIEKRFLVQEKLSESKSEGLRTIISLGDVKALRKHTSDKNAIPHLLTEDEECIQGFFYNHKGAKLIVPEPDPVLIYFHTAQSNYAQIESTRNEMLVNLNPKDIIDEKMIHQIFQLLHFL